MFEYRISTINISKPNKIDDKEMYLCNCVALQLHKVGLTKKQKYLLTEKYLTVKYMDRIKYGNLQVQKEELSQDVQNIAPLKNSLSSTSSVSLNDAYKAYNLTQRFDNEILKLKDDLIEYATLESIKFIFSTLKIHDPFLYSIYYQMQYAFWQVVIAGGYFEDYELSARLLTNSLSKIEEKPCDVILTDNYTLEKVVYFQKRIYNSFIS